MNELHLGIMTTKELADWASKSEKYLSKNKKHWCESNLSQYELVHGGVRILEIKNPYFQTSARKKVKKIYYDHFGHYDSENNVCRYI